MTHEELMLLARAVADESAKRGFPHTAEAMRQVIEGMLLGQQGATDVVNPEKSNSKSS